MLESLFRTKPPPFDFDAEVTRIRNDFPEETKDVTFIDISAPGAAEKVRRWVCGHSELHRVFLDLAYTEAEEEEKVEIARMASLPFPEFLTALEEFDPEAKEMLEKLVEEEIAEYLKGSTARFSYKTTEKKLVIVQTISDRRLGFSAEKSPYFSLYHELGHIIIGLSGPFDALEALAAKPSEERQISEKRNSENGADTFALLYGLRNSVFDAQDLPTLGKERAVNAICGDIWHFTSEAIDDVISQINTDGPENIPLEEIVKSARMNTKKFERSPDEIGQFKKATDEFRTKLVFSTTSREDIAAHFKKAAVRKTDSLESYIAQAFSASSARSLKRFCTPLTRWWSSLQARMKRTF